MDTDERRAELRQAVDYIIQDEARRAAMATANKRVFDAVAEALGISSISRIDVAEMLECYAVALRAEIPCEPESDTEREGR